MDVFARALASLGAGKLQADEEKRQANLQAQANDRANAASSLAQQEGQQNLAMGQQKLQMGPLDRAKQLFELNQQGVDVMSPTAPTASTTGPAAALGMAANAAGYQPGRTDLGDVGGGQHAYATPNGGIAAKISKALDTGDPGDIGAVLAIPGFGHLGPVLTRPPKGPDPIAVKSAEQDAENQKLFPVFQALYPNDPHAKLPYDPHFDYNKYDAGLQQRATMASQQADRQQRQKESEDFRRSMVAGKVDAGRQQLASLLPSLESDHTQINAIGAPNIFARGVSHLPFVGNQAEGILSPATQQLQSIGGDWTIHYMQALHAARMSPPTLKYINETYIPQTGDGIPMIKTKNANRERAMQEVRTRAGSSVDVHDLNDAPSIP